MPIEKVIGDLENPQRKESLRPLQLTPQEKKVSSDLLIELSTRLLNLFRVIGKSY